MAGKIEIRPRRRNSGALVAFLIRASRSCLKFRINTRAIEGEGEKRQRSMKRRDGCDRRERVFKPGRRGRRGCRGCDG